jgi:hypothetical protein
MAATMKSAALKSSVAARPSRRQVAVRAGKYDEELIATAVSLTAHAVIMPVQTHLRELVLMAKHQG